MWRFRLSFLTTLLVLRFASHALAFRYKDFEVQRCTATQGKALRVAIDDLVDTGQRVLDELDLIDFRGQDLSRFNAFFTSRSSVKTVKDILLKVTDAADVTIYDQFGIEAQRPPNFVCVNRGDATVAKVYESTCSSGRYPAVWIERTQFIFLCPPFFRMHPAVKATVPQECPAVVNGKWPKVRSHIRLDQLHVLVHELTHVYLGLPQVHPEVRSLQSVHELPPKMQLRNANNYALYWGCECHPVFL